MQTTNQRKRVILLAVAFLAVGVLAVNAEARPNKRDNRAARAQHRDRNRGHPRADRKRHKDRGREHGRIERMPHRRGGKDKGGVTISFNLGGHDRVKWVQPRHAGRRHGHYERRWAPPVYETRYDRCGRRYEVVVREGHWRKVWVPDHRPKHRRGHRLHRCSAGCHDRRPDSGITIQGHFRF